MQDNKKRKLNLGTVIGWLIFILVIAGGPIFSMLRSALGGTVTLPGNLMSTVIIGLVVLSMLVSIGRAVGRASRGRQDSRLPTGSPDQPASSPMPPFSGPTSSPMPPFGGPAARQAPTSSPAPTMQPPSATPISPPVAGQERLPRPPSFEPILNPRIVVIGIVGLVLIGAVMLAVLRVGLP
ncbi:MAG: hypothetical protein IPO81_15770 [Kouleothrix sp.]|nr:hypothetical protein [Kouleothrix sp.]